MADLIKMVEQDYLKKEIPPFRPGDTVKVHVKVVEGSRERTQVFEGAVIRRRGSGLGETFTVRRVSYGVGVERTSRCIPRAWTGSRSCAGEEFNGRGSITCVTGLARPHASRKGSREILTKPSETGNVPVWRDLLESVVLAVILAAILRLFIIQPFYIPSASMEPTLLPNDRIIVNMLAYRFHPPQRDDVIVFRYPLDPSRDFIKRIVAFGGETVEVRNNTLIVNGVRIMEPFLPHEYYPNYGPFTVPQGSYFVMGDNRNNSDDSRAGARFPSGTSLERHLLSTGRRGGWV